MGCFITSWGDAGRFVLKKGCVGLGEATQLKSWKAETLRQNGGERVGRRRKGGGLSETFCAQKQARKTKKARVGRHGLKGNGGALTEILHNPLSMAFMLKANLTIYRLAPLCSCVE